MASRTPTIHSSIIYTLVLGISFISFLGIIYWSITKNPSDHSKLTQAPLPGSTRISPIDGMVLVYIPAGEFTMGENGDKDNSPQHIVDLDAYWIDLTEVTNEMYSKCVQAGKCEFSVKNAPTDIHFENPAYANDPVVYITWEDALEYCLWAGGRLPTEAEWEKAARGIDVRKYPWGNFPPDHTLLNFDNLVGDTRPVGSYLAGASPYGVLDMAGNVREWVADWFSSSYYQVSLFKNPMGPISGNMRVLRGGSFVDNSQRVRVTNRFAHAPGSAGMNRGFRCVISE